MADILKVKVGDVWRGIAVTQGDITPVQSDWEQDDDEELDYIKNKPTKLSDFADDTSTNPVDKADTLTGLTSSITELNYCDGVTSNIQTQFSGKTNLELTNATPTSAFATALNTAGIRTVVETYSSGAKWYRVWSDKWCEQGNFISGYSSGTAISLTKSYADTNYSVQITFGGSSARNDVPSVHTKTASSFKVVHNASNNNGFGIYWQTCGYIE